MDSLFRFLVERSAEALPSSILSWFGVLAAFYGLSRFGITGQVSKWKSFLVCWAASSVVVVLFGSESTRFVGGANLTVFGVGLLIGAAGRVREFRKPKV